MKTKIDERVAWEFVECLGRMITIRHEPKGLTNDRRVLFCISAAGEEDGFEHASEKDVDMDIIVLAFKPGRESDGPVNVAVYEKREGKLTTWPRCQPWVFDKRDGQGYLAVEGQEIGFSYDNAKPSLTIVKGLPLEQRAERVATAKILLRMMPQFIRQEERIVLHRVIRNPGQGFEKGRAH